MKAILAVQERFSSPMQASKWLHLQLLLDPLEMQQLFEELQEFYIVQSGQITQLGQDYLTQQNFLSYYSDYVNCLKKGILPQDPNSNHYFTSLFSLSLETFYKVFVGKEKQMIQAKAPAVQLQHHRFICGADQTLRSMAFGPSSIFWGLQFSYPQLYQTSLGEVVKVEQNENFPNTALFKTIQKWARYHTVPTPFLINSQKKVNSPIRLGKQCFAWINNHPQLQKGYLQVIV